MLSCAYHQISVNITNYHQSLKKLRTVRCISLFQRNSKQFKGIQTKEKKLSPTSAAICTYLHLPAPKLKSFRFSIFDFFRFVRCWTLDVGRWTFAFTPNFLCPLRLFLAIEFPRDRAPDHP